MAILRNFTAKILVNDQALQEYEGDGEMENENPDMVVKHVQATSNARFTINISVRDMSRSMADVVTFYLYLDGTCVDGSFLRSDDPKQDLWNKESNWDGKRVVSSEGNWELIPFMFSEIKIGQSKEISMIDQSHITIVEALAPLDLRKPSILDEIGTITIKVLRGNKYKRNVKPKPLETKQLDKLTEVAENMLKGMPLTHVSTYGP